MHRQLTIVALALAVAVPASAQTRSAVGDVVLLSTRPIADVVAPLRSALAADDARVRAAAARVILAKPAPELIVELGKALIGEQDPTAGSEMIRALLILHGPSAAAAVEPHASRLGGASAITYVEWLAAHDPARFAAAIAAMPVDATGVRGGALRHAVIRAAGVATVRPDVLTAWSRIAPVGDWKSVLESLIRIGPDLRAADAMLNAALTSERAHIREETIWFLIDAMAAGHRLSPALLASIVRPSSSTDWESFGRELLYRHEQRAEPIDATAFLTSRPSLHRLRAVATRLTVLTGQEMAAFKGRHPDLRPAPRPSMFDGPATARTVQVWADGLVSELAKSAGCPVSETMMAGVATVTFRADGRPKQIAVDNGRLPERCVPVFHALLVTTVAEIERAVPEDEQLLVLLPLNQAFIACVDQPVHTVGRVGTEVGEAVLTTPRKIKDVRPEYPPSMLKARQDGVVVIEATITTNGCTRDLRVVKSSGAVPLDLAGLTAVSQWMFEPTRLDGTPVATKMTVTVSFKVQ